MPLTRRLLQLPLGAALAAAVIFMLSAAPGVSQAQAAADHDILRQLLREKSYDRARELAERQIKTQPRDAQLRLLLGVIQRESGRTNDAIATFTRLAEDFPNLPEPHNNLAVIYAAQGQYEKARVALEKALRTHPSYAAAHDNLTGLYERMASEAYSRALQLSPAARPAEPLALALLQEMRPAPGVPVPPAAPATQLAQVPAAAQAPVAQPVASPAAAPASTPATPAPVAAPAPATVVASPAVAPPAPSSAVAAAAPVPAPAPVPAFVASAAPIAPAMTPPAPPVAPPAAPAVTPAAVAATATPVAPAATPAPAPTPHKPASPEPAGENQAIEQALQAWAQAWSDRNMNAYLASYAATFELPAQQSRNAWEQERRARILGKKTISVQLSNIRITLDGERAVAKFIQDYKADTLAVVNRKTIEFVKSDGRWLIVREASGG